MRFIGKSPRRKNVRPVVRRQFNVVIKNDSDIAVEEAITEQPSDTVKEDAVTETLVTDPAVVETVENKDNQGGEEMNDIETLKNIVDGKAKLPKRKVRVERKEKGLLERTDNSTLLITEDNKIMLND